MGEGQCGTSSYACCSQPSTGSAVYLPGQCCVGYAQLALQHILQAAVQQQCWHAGQEIGEVEPQQDLGLLELLVELVQQGGDGGPWDLVADLECALVQENGRGTGMVGFQGRMC